MSHLLELSGYEVRAACDGAEALAAAGPRPALAGPARPDDAADGRRRGPPPIRADPGLGDLPVLSSPATCSTSGRQQLEALGVSATLAKPIDFDELLDVLGRFLEPSPTP